MKLLIVCVLAIVVTVVTAHGAGSRKMKAPPCAAIGVTMAVVPCADNVTCDQGPVPVKVAGVMGQMYFCKGTRLNSGDRNGTASNSRDHTAAPQGQKNGRGWARGKRGADKKREPERRGVTESPKQKDVTKGQQSKDRTVGPNQKGVAEKKNSNDRTEAPRKPAVTEAPQMKAGPRKGKN